MDRLISVSIIRPIAVIAAVLMIVMFGGVALQSIPIQLTPDVNQPVITITTQWPGAAPNLSKRMCKNIGKCYEIWKDTMFDGEFGAEVKEEM